MAAPPCATADLTVTNEGNVGGAGSWGDLYTFRNVSQRTCSLTGYARIELRTGAGVYRPLQEVTAKSFPGFPYFGMRTTGRVTFANLHARTGVASFWIVSHDVPVGSGSGQVCHVALAISITPPRSATALSLGFARDSGLDWCGTSIGVTPIVVGNSGTLPYRPRSFFFP